MFGWKHLQEEISNRLQGRWCRKDIGICQRTRENHRGPLLNYIPYARVKLTISKPILTKNRQFREGKEIMEQQISYLSEVYEK